MKIKLVVIDFELSARAKRLAAAVIVPLLVLGGGAVAYAKVPKAWSPGDTLTAADLNGNFDSLDKDFAGLDQRVKTVEGGAPAVAGAIAALQSEQSRRITGVDAQAATVNATTVNPATTQMIWQAASTVVNTDAAGLATVTFPAAFPNGILTVVANTGDVTCGDGITQGPYSKGSFVYHTSANGLCRINWIAIGW